MSKIFISSTCYDLVDLRAELKRYISSLGLTPIMSDQPETEFVTFADQNSIETCLINLRSSDVVLLILSQRYGPSLVKAGFTDHSATHLEYLEAIKLGKRIIVFVRDRLEADYTNYKKTSDEKSLQWIGVKDIRLFEIIDDRIKLKNAGIDNWYWTFKSSVDLKERLQVDLKADIQEQRLSHLINSGNMAMLTLKDDGSQLADPSRLSMKLQLSNVGNQSAVEPLILIYKANSYDDVIAKKLEESILNYNLIQTESIQAGQTCSTETFSVAIEKNEIVNHKIRLIIDIAFKTIYGDWISDVSELDIYINISNGIKIFPKFVVKRLRDGASYNKMTEETIKKMLSL